MKNKYQKYHGWLFVDKKRGLTSLEVVKQVRKVFGISKVGHAGTLDPLAEGLLAVAVGEATKTINYAMNTSKEYVFTVQFGETTDTLDMEGEIVELSDKIIETKEEIEEILTEFTGYIEQTPPKYSAIKLDGKRAYKLAREGKEVILPARTIYISDISLLSFDKDKQQATLKATVNKGSYIRSLGYDIAFKLGSVGYITFLRRTRIAKVEENILFSSDLLYNGDVEDIKGRLYPIDYLLDDILAISLEYQDALKLKQGIIPETVAKQIKALTKVVCNEVVVAILGLSPRGQVKIMRVFNLALNKNGEI